MMRIARLSPLEIIPVDAPYNPNTVHSLMCFYDQLEEQPDKAKALDKQIPFVFVHRVKGHGLYMVDGHHRAGVAQAHDCYVNAILLNTFRDLSDAYVLADMKLIPEFEFSFPIEKRLSDLSWQLPEARKRHALRRGIRDFDDYAKRILQGNYHGGNQPELQ
ncbi:hypothetical protein KY306_02995, partial [Candidatus Woesearchaeota archaeon]|nr:hypothetical protein [Candidatus Woesearchaeota archaeon]